MHVLGLNRGRLLERESELKTLELAVRSCTPRGSVLAVSGSPGCGKTTLLEAACLYASEAGHDVLLARGSELEQGFAFGGVRQVLERPASRLANCDATRLEEGAAARGWATVQGDDPSVAVDEFATLHGLYWLLATIAEKRPTLLAVDDAHWLDTPSLRWLEYLSHRIGELPVLLMVATRPPNRGAPVELRRLLADRATAQLRPRPLSRDAIAELLELGLGTNPAPDFVAACERASGGNAFVVRELVDALAADGVVPSDAEAARIATRPPSAVAESLLLRLDRLRVDARAVARALAVCGDGSSIQLLAAVAGLSPELTEEAIDSLAGADLVQPEPPPRFVHALVRSAIEMSLSAGERAGLHRRCAQALQRTGGDPETVAVHWLGTEPMGSQAVVEQLRVGARRAIGRGGPASAVTYLRRAIGECAAPAAGLLHELGKAELLARDPACTQRLLDALAGESDPHRRAAVGIDAVDALMFSGCWPECLELAQKLQSELPNEDPLSLAFDDFIAASLLDGSPAERPSDLERLRERASRHASEARGLCLQVAAIMAVRGGDPEEVVQLVERGYADGDFFLTGRSDSSVLSSAVMALLFVGRYDSAREVTEGMLADARRRGLVLGHASGAAHRGLVALKTGELRDAEADLKDAFTLALDHDLRFTLPFIAAYLASTLLDRGQFDEAVSVIERIDEPGADTIRPGAAAFYEARGLVRGATGDLPRAIEDLRTAGRAGLAMRTTNPLANRWRSHLALLTGGESEALGLATEELEQAQAVGVTIGIGVATRTLALIDAPEHREGRLRIAMAQLQDSPARLEHARTLVDLGTVLRQRGARKEAREHLLLGLDLADRCGAAQLAERARGEAIAAGARPRRSRLTGPDALTASELVVARLASQGMTNTQIAQALFVTIGTVKDHLGSAYRKLEIGSRSELRAVLADDRDVTP